MIVKPDSTYILNNGQIESIGYNLMGQLGHYTSSKFGRVNIKGDIDLFAASKTQLVMKLTNDKVYILGQLLNTPRIYVWPVLIKKDAPIIGVYATNAYIILQKECGEIEYYTYNFEKDQIQYNPITERRNIIKIATGSSHVLLLCSNGELIGMGNNRVGQLGTSKRRFKCYTTHMIAKDPNIIDIACGGAFSIYVTKDGGIYTFGHNKFGELGLGHRRHVRRPTLAITAPVMKIVCGYLHTLVLTKSRQLWVWGDNNCGQLGLGKNYKNTYRPARLKNALFINEIGCGAYHSLYIRQDGLVYGFGQNIYNQLNVSQYNVVYKPVMIYKTHPHSRLQQHNYRAKWSRRLHRYRSYRHREIIRTIITCIKIKKILKPPKFVFRMLINMILV